jgi:conjugal transfer ATP-binding protein TraC
MGPVELIAFLDDFLCPAVDNADKPEHYSELDPINVQCVRRDLETQVTPDRIVLKTERFRPTGEEIDGAPVIGEVVPDKFDWRFFAVRTCPSNGRRGTSRRSSATWSTTSCALAATS